jgi:3-deoxy-7-phosphoheptulonate synthase
MKKDLSNFVSKFPLVASLEPSERLIVSIADTRFGDGGCVVMAGPCAVESERQICEAAEGVARWGAKVLRGGAFKPRSSPYAFQGLGLAGLKLLRKAADATGLSVVTEVMSKQDLPAVVEYADLMQVGSRSMENFELLEALGQCGKPVLLKRGLCSTLEDLLASAQVVVECGNPNVMLCERGIRTFETSTRNTLDINGVAVLKAVSRLPVIVDPSHAIGIRALVPKMARVAVAADADGLLVEVHPRPEQALSDGDQSLNVEEFRLMMGDLRGYVDLRAQCAEEVGAR